MKNLKRLTAVLLTAAMMIGMTGCAMGGKLAPKKLADSAKKYGAEEVKDAEDFADMIEEGEDLEDGAYITASGKDVKDILKASDVTSDLYDSSITNATLVVVGDNEDNTAAFLFAFTFSSKKDAQDFYDDCVEDIEDMDDSGYDFDSDDGEENGVSYYVGVADAGFYGVSEGVYLSGKTVFIVLGVGSDVDDCNDIIDDIGSCYDVVLPSEL